MGVAHPENLITPTGPAYVTFMVYIYRGCELVFILALDKGFEPHTTVQCSPFNKTFYQTISIIMVYISNCSGNHTFVE